jgi:hypothetical protein
MTHYINVIGAFLLDAVEQAPVIVQYQQSAPQPEWKWWIGALAPWIGPLFSGAVSIYVAWRVFRWQGEKDRRQWLLDQKKAEWRELLKCNAEIQRVLRMDSMSRLDRAREIAGKLKPATHELSVTSASCVFLQDFFSDIDKSKKFYSFLLEADQAAESINTQLTLFRQGDIELTQQEQSTSIVNIMQEADRITGRYFEFRAWLRKEAAISLGTISDATNVVRSPLMPSS